MVAFAAGAGVRSTPESPPLIDGAEAFAPFRALADGLGIGGLGRNGGAALAFLVMALAVGGFLLGLRETWRGHISVRTVLWLGIAFQLLMAALPLLLSKDVYSYAMYGRIDAVYQQNPYVVTPAHFPNDPVYPFVGEVWRDTPVVYGPAFTLLAGALAGVITSPAGLVWAFKAVGGLAGIGTLLLIAWIARRVAPGRAAFAVALFGWNPAVVAFATGGGHNDLLVALLLTAALAVLVRGRVFDSDRVADPGRWPRHELAAVALLTLGALVKASVAPALVLLVVASAASRPAGSRLRVVVLQVLVAVGMTVAFALPYWQTSNPTLGIAELAKHREWISATRLLMATLGGIGESIGGDGGRTAVEAVIRLGMALTAVIGLVVVARAVARRASPSAPTGALGAAGLGASWGWGLLVTLLAAPVLFPWYLAWMLPVAWLLPRAGRNVVVGASVLLTISRALAEPELLPGLYRTILWIGHNLIGPVFLILLVWVMVRVVRIGRGESPLADPSLEAAVPVAAGAPGPSRDEDPAERDSD
jgi:hypothetical protein